MDEGKFTLLEEGKTATFEWPEKFSSKISITKDAGGFIFYTISFDTGKLPKALNGRFSSIPKAVEVIRAHYRQMKPTTVARRDEVGKRVQERLKAEKDGSTDRTKGSKPVRKGADN